MRMFLIVAALAALAALAGGCRTGLTEDGRPCYELSEHEVRVLVERTRESLLNSTRNRAITVADKAVLRNAAPESVVIRYTGDKFGLARVCWVANKKRFTIWFEKDLVSERPLSRLAVERIFDDGDTIYFRKDTPKKR